MGRSGASKALVATSVAISMVAGLPSNSVAHRLELTRHVRATLLRRAREVAKLDGDSRPYDVVAVRTTRIKALKLAPGATEPLCESSPSCTDAPWYVVAMRGHFVCNTCSPPPGGHIARGSVITLEIEAKEPLPPASGFALGTHYPKLQKLGSPAQLSPVRSPG